MSAARSRLAAAADLVAVADGVATDPQLDEIGVALGRSLIDEAIGELVSARFALTEVVRRSISAELAA